MYCKYCGTEVSPSHIYCAGCGAPVSAERSVPLTPEVIVAERPAVHVKEEPKTCLILAIVFASVGLIPFINMLLLPPAIVLGIVGLFTGRRVGLKVTTAIILTISLIVSVFWMVPFFSDLDSEDRGEWHIDYELDEFERPVEMDYMTNTEAFEGKIKEISGEYDLEAYVIVHRDGVDLQLHRYHGGPIRVQEYTVFNVTFLDENGTKHYTTATMDPEDESMHLADWMLVELLKTNETVQVYVAEQENDEADTYLFTAVRGNFNDVYHDYYQGVFISAA